jgi:hypothetical protein
VPAPRLPAPEGRHHAGGHRAPQQQQHRPLCLLHAPGRGEGRCCGLRWCCARCTRVQRAWHTHALCACANQHVFAHSHAHQQSRLPLAHIHTHIHTHAHTHAHTHTTPGAPAQGVPAERGRPEVLQRRGAPAGRPPCVHSPRPARLHVLHLPHHAGALQVRLRGRVPAVNHRDQLREQRHPARARLVRVGGPCVLGVCVWGGGGR